MKLPLLLCALLACPLHAADDDSTAAALRAWKSRDFAGANKLLEAPLAEQKPAALYLKGQMAETGRGAEFSLTEAARLYRQAMDKGSADATAAIGRFTVSGLGGIEKDPDRGLFLLRKAAEAGSTAAMTILGDLALNGAGQEADPKTALFWYQSAAKEKDPLGYLGMAALFDVGAAGLVKDDSHGTALVLESVKLGEPRAMNEMGLRYQSGRGVRRDNVAAIGWFHMASQHGLPAAMVNLGIAYRKGDGCIADFNLAGQQLSAAAKLNFAPAQFQIAQMFEAGEGTGKQPVYAYINYARAAAGGVKEAEEKRDAVKAILSSQQLSEAETLLKSGGK
jgi:uncharacterized protein